MTTQVTELIGRAQELDRLRAHWQRASGGQSESVLVRGEPGIGKTSFVRHFTAQLASSEALVLVAPGRLGTDTPPLWPWIQFTRQLQRTCPDALFEDELVLAAFGPWLAPTTRGQAARGAACKPTHFQLLDSLTQLLIRVVERAPVCLVLEDVHDFDPESLAVAHELLQPACSSAVLMLGTCRTSAALYAGERLTSVIERFEHCLQLSGLHGDEVAELMAARLRRPVSMALARRVHRRTDGNPLYVRALSSVLESAPHGFHDSLDVDGIRLPDSLRRAGSRQLHGLSDTCRRTLEAAAILGRDFEQNDLAQMLGHSEPDAVEPALSEAARDGIVCLDPQQRGRYRFSHALLHEWLSEELSPEARARAHRQAALVMYGVSMSADERDHCRSFAAAHHWLHGGDAESLARAAQAAQRAGCHARERGADAESAEAFKIAVNALHQQLRAPQLSAAQQEALRKQLALALCDMSDALWRSGQQHAALAGLLEVADLAHILNDAELMVAAALITLDNYNVFLAPEQQKLCDLACARLDQVSARSRVQLCAQLGVQRCVSGNHAAGLRFIEQAREAYADAGADPQAELALLYAEAIQCDQAAPLEQRRALLDRYSRAAAAHGNQAAIVFAECGFLQCALESADPDAVLHHERALALAVRRLGARLNWLHNSLRWMLAFVRGQFDEAKRLLEVLAPGEHHAGSAVQVLHLTESLAIARLLGDPRLQLASSVPQDAALRSIPEFAAALACVCAEDGDLAQARVALAHAQLVGPHSLLGQCQLTIAARELNDAAYGAQLHAALLPFERRFAILPGGIVSIGAVAQYVGMAALAEGRTHAAVAHFETAIQMNQAMGALPALARTHYELARTLHAMGVPVRAHEHARIAAQLATALGMRPLAERTAALCSEEAPAAASGEEARPGSPPEEPSTASNQWHKHGALWELSFAGQTTLLAHCKGLDYIAQLLTRPGVEVHVLELMGPRAEAASVREPGADSLSTRAHLESYEPQLDATCRAQYRQRASALQEALEEAEQLGDLGRCERLQAERELLLRELSQGIRARSRPIERARKAVYNRIRDTLHQLEQVHPSLARHLQVSVRTGVYCRYEPEREHRWSV